MFLVNLIKGQKYYVFFRDFDMPDTQFAAQANQLPPLPSKETQFAYGIPMDSVTTSTLPASFKKVRRD